MTQSSALPFKFLDRTAISSSPAVGNDKAGVIFCACGKSPLSKSESERVRRFDFSGTAGAVCLHVCMGKVGPPAAV